MKKKEGQNVKKKFDEENLRKKRPRPTPEVKNKDTRNN